MANPRWAETSVPRSLPDRVAQLYYSNGLFCASHPIIIICVAVSIVLLCCYPLLSLPLPGNVPQSYTMSSSNNTAADMPRWLQTAEPACYIQQVVMKAAVSPWTDDMILTDAFRAPLAEVFRLLEVIQNYQGCNSSITLSDVCMHIETACSKPYRDILPQYSCLVLSPANFWHQDVQQYHSDTNLVSTIFNYQNLQKGKISLAELLFGLNMKDTGIKRYPLRRRQRIIQFAVTVVLRQYNKEYMDGLKDTLRRLYPLHQEDSIDAITTDLLDSSLHIYYPGEFDYRELVPLSGTYILLFVYIYFSVRKIELVRSKVVIAVSAVFTVLASLCMSVGLCFFFGLELAGNGHGREIFPYLVAIVGLENVLVLTKSVVSTPSHLDVKIRIAQGLSREGWSITKNLLTEVTILTVGLLTLVPTIQEFCIFAIVGLLSDFFLQMFFYATVLGMDIKHMERTDTSQTFYHHRYSPARNSALPRSRSVPRLSYPTPQPKLPKRIQLVNFWAKTRIVQRAFMLVMICWIGGIVYSAGILHNLASIDSVSDGEIITERVTTESILARYKSPLSGEGGRKAIILEMEAKLLAAEEANRQRLKQVKDSDELSRLQPESYDPLHRLSPHHWSAILSLYNTTFLSGSYITILPGIQLASPVSPDRAIALRNPLEKQIPKFQWQSLAVALDPLDLTDGEYESAIPAVKSSILSSDAPFVPSSPMELFLTAVLCVISVLVVAYTMLVLYRCICTRNYAEWRASWSWHKESAEDSTEVVLEAVPLILAGHHQQIECLCTDGNCVVSSCLAGELRVWDAMTGDPVTTIYRNQSQNNIVQNGEDDSLYKQLESTYSLDTKPSFLRSRIKQNYVHSFPDFSPSIKLNFSAQKYIPKASEVDSKEGFDYGPVIQSLYDDFKMTRPSDSEFDCDHPYSSECDRRKRTSISDEVKESYNCMNSDVTDSVKSESPIWCLDCQDNLIAVGCGNGRLELWEATTGKLKCLVGDGGDVCAGVTCIRIVSHHLLVARLSGSLDFYLLDWGNRHSVFRRTHVRTGSAGSALDWPISEPSEENLNCIRVSTARAHQQPITVLECEGGRVITGSQDHTLKVYGLVDQAALYTLHGHCGPITTLFIDRVTPLLAGSGSQDGLLCVWDLQTGACMYSIQAHDGCITSLTYSASYVISLGSDERLCVWERFQGHLLNTIQVSHTYCSSMAMLTHNLLITSKQGSLVVWDVRTGEPVRIVKLGHSDSCIFVQHIVMLHDSVACDYGKQLRIVRFPLVHDKSD